MDDLVLFDEVLLLTIRCQSEDTTDEDLARLERLLDESREAAVFYVKLVEDGLTVREAGESRANAALAFGADDASDSCRNLGAEIDEALDDAARTRRRSTPLRMVSLVAAMAASVLLLIAGAQWLAGIAASSEAPTARVVNLSGAQWVSGAKEYGQWSTIVSGDVLELREGMVNVFISSGVDMLIEGPAEVRFDSLERVVVSEGQLAARVGPDAIGFSIETPHANVIDRGTSFGISVNRSEQTDVVVYDGIVDLDVVGHGQKPRRRLAAGEALRVDNRGDLSRINSVRADEFLPPPPAYIGPNRRDAVIESVSDNIRLLDTAKYCRVIPGGFTEDCQAYVDREHQWNGLDAHGIPDHLLGGDYVMTFNDDKTDTEFEMVVKLARPANLYVLIDNRVPPPDWLVQDFEDTTLEVGLDEIFRHINVELGVGAGKSIDQVYSVWHRKVSEAGNVVLGPLGRQVFTRPARVVQRGMYGIVATPLEKN